MRFGSVATSVRKGDVASFAAVRAIIKAIHAKTNVKHALADSAVLFTGAAIFRQITLRTNGRTLHTGLSAKLYLSMGGCGKSKLSEVR